MLLRNGEDRFGELLHGDIRRDVLDIHADFAPLRDREKRRARRVRHVEAEVGVPLPHKMGFAVSPVAEAQLIRERVQIEREYLSKQTLGGDEVTPVPVEAKARGSHPFIRRQVVLQAAQTCRVRVERDAPNVHRVGGER